MSTPRNVTSTAKFCLGWQTHATEASVALPSIDSIELPVRLPSSRPLNRRWDQSRGLAIVDVRRKIHHERTWRSDGAVVSNNSSSAKRTFASRPPPGKRPMHQELDQFMVSKESPRVGLGDRNVIAKTIAERNDAQKERDMARAKEQLIKQNLARLEAEATVKLEQAKTDIKQLKTRNATLDQQRMEVSRERDLAQKSWNETNRAFRAAENKIATLKEQYAILEQDFAKHQSEIVKRDEERTTEHKLVTDDLLKQVEALAPAQESLRAREQELEAREEQMVKEKQRLLQQYSDDVTAFRSKLRKEYEESEFVKDIRSRHKIVEENQSAQMHLEWERVQHREQELHTHSLETEANLTTELDKRVLHVENKAVQTQNAVLQALNQRREDRSARRSQYDDHRSLFTSVLKVDVLKPFARVQAELRHRLTCLPLSPAYLDSIKNSNPWFPIKYPDLVARLQRYGSARRSEINADLDSARLLVRQVELARRTFIGEAHKSRESTRYFHTTPVPNNFDKVMLLYRVSLLQHMRDEIFLCTLAVRQLDASSIPSASRMRRIAAEMRIRKILKQSYDYLTHVARAKATQAMQDDKYSKKVAFKVLHEQQKKFQQALLHIPQHTLSFAEHQTLKRTARKVGDAIRQFEAEVQKRAMLQQRLHPELVLKEEADFRRWSMRVHDQHMTMARNDVESLMSAAQTEVSRVVRMPLTQRQPGLQAKLREHAVISKVPTNLIARSDRSTKRLKKSTSTLSNTKMERKIEPLKVEQQSLRKNLESYKGERIKRQTNTNEPVPIESPSLRSLNLKPSAPRQARRGLSHAVNIHNNCFDSIDVAYINAHSSLMPFSEHANAHRSPLLAGHVENSTVRVVSSPRHQDINLARPPRMSTRTDEQSTGGDLSIAVSDREDTADSLALSDYSAETDIDSPSCSSPALSRDSEPGCEDQQDDSHAESDVALTYHIPAQDYHEAVKASRSTDAAFWTYRLYKNPDGARPTIHYCTKFDQAEEQAQHFINEAVLGFDMEWEVGSTMNSSIKNSVSLVQIASEDKVGLFQIAMFKGKTIEELMPSTLRAILESDKIIKAGVNISGDSTRMGRCLNVKMRGLMELSHMFKVVTLSEQEPHKVNRGLVSLAEQVEKILLLPLKKDKVRTSAWSKRLNTNQTEYAGTDAYAGLRLYHALEQKRKVMNPKPPRPAYYELQEPLVLGDGTVIKLVPRRAAGKKKPGADDEELSEDEFFDAVETQETSEDDVLDDGSNTPFSPVEAVYPILPSAQIDINMLRTADAELFSSRERAPHIASTSHVLDSDGQGEPHETTLPLSSSNTADNTAAETSLSNTKVRSTTRKPPPDTPEMALATSWTDTWLASKRDGEVAKAGPAALRVYHLWHMQNLDIPRVAELGRDPSLMPSTVASYIMTALSQERLPYDPDRVQDVLEHLPRAASGRYERFFSRRK